jgi:hypothetical protein
MRAAYTKGAASFPFGRRQFTVDLGKCEKFQIQPAVKEYTRNKITTIPVIPIVQNRICLLCFSSCVVMFASNQSSRIIRIIRRRP